MTTATKNVKILKARSKFSVLGVVRRVEVEVAAMAVLPIQLLWHLDHGVHVFGPPVDHHLHITHEEGANQLHRISGQHLDPTLSSETPPLNPKSLPNPKYDVQNIMQKSMIRGMKSCGMH